VRNQADGMIHATRRMLQEAGDKAPADEKSTIEAAIAALETLAKGEDKAAIEEGIRKLTEASSTLTQRMHAEQAGDGDADAGASRAGDSDAVDAEFEEVKDDKQA
jgi:molecular chaperone DnaK